MDTSDRIHNSQAIGTDEPHSAAAQLPPDLVFKLCAFSASFLEACGDHHGAAHSRPHAFTNQAWYRRSRSNNNSQVQFFRNACYVPVAAQSENFFVFGIDCK